MRRVTKRRLSTAIGITLGAVTLTGPLAGHYLAEYQCNRGLCDHDFHWHRYEAPR